VFLGFCPINEGCPFLWGYPACVYGFIMFFILFLSSVIFYYKEDLFNNLVIAKVSFIGILFSLYYALVELFFTECPGGCHYSLGFPTCIYGLFMYSAVFIIIMRHKKISPVHVLKETFK
jgi:disulfide bond formation protein DsbB